MARRRPVSRYDEHGRRTRKETGRSAPKVLVVGFLPLEYILIPALRELLPTLRDDEAAEARLVERERSIGGRSRALLEATATLRAALEGA